MCLAWIQLKQEPTRSSVPLEGRAIDTNFGGENGEKPKVNCWSSCGGSQFVRDGLAVLPTSRKHKPSSKLFQCACLPWGEDQFNSRASWWLWPPTWSGQPHDCSRDKMIHPLNDTHKRLPKIQGYVHHYAITLKLILTRAYNWNMTVKSKHEVL